MTAIDSPRFRRLAKEGGWIVTGQVAAVFGGLVLIRVLTEYLTPTQYGQLALGLTVATLVNQSMMGGIIAGIGRFYCIAVEKRDTGAYLHASARLLAYAAFAVIAIGGLLAAVLLWLARGQWITLVVATILFSILAGINGALSGIQNAARQRAVVAFHAGTEAWLKILLAFLAILWLGATSAAVVGGYALAALVVTGSQLLFLRRTITAPSAGSAWQTQTGRSAASWIQQIWAYSWPFSIFGFFTWMQQVSDRWALQAYASSADVGQFAVLFQLGYAPIVLLTGMAMSFLGPILYQRSGDATDHARNRDVHRLGWRITRMSLILTLLAFGFAFALHGWLFRFLVASEYRGSSFLLPWVILAGGVFSAGQMLALKLMSDMKSVEMTAAKIVTALAGVLFNLAGAIMAGVEGVVCALVAFSLCYFIWMTMLVRRLSIKKSVNIN